MYGDKRVTGATRRDRTGDLLITNKNSATFLGLTRIRSGYQELRNVASCQRHARLFRLAAGNGSQRFYAGSGHKNGHRMRRGRITGAPQQKSEPLRRHRYSRTSFLRRCNDPLMCANHGVSERIGFPSQHEPVSWVVRRGRVFNDWIAVRADVSRGNGSQIVGGEFRESVFRWPPLFNHERFDVDG
jgi:hypothetical protein